MVDPSGRDLHRGLARLAAMAKRDLTAALAGARTVDHARAIMERLMPDLIDTYGSAGATAAADWYDAVRDKQRVAGRFRASVPPKRDPGVGPLTGWAASNATSLETFQDLALGGYTRRILNYSRSTVTRNAVADPGAGGWMRQGDGDSCEFCAMLIGRGAVYGEHSVDFASHDHCGCVAVPAFRGRARPVRLADDGKRLTVSGRSDRTNDEQRRVSNERARAWIESHPNAG